MKLSQPTILVGKMLLNDWQMT